MRSSWGLVALALVTMAGTGAAAEPRVLRPGDIRGTPDDYGPDREGMASRHYPGEIVQVQCVVYQPPGVTPQGKPLAPRFGQCRIVGPAAQWPYVASVAEHFERRARPMPGVSGEVIVNLRIPGDG